MKEGEGSGGEGRGLCDFAPQPKLPGYATADSIEPQYLILSVEGRRIDKNKKNTENSVIGV